MSNIARSLLKTLRRPWKHSQRSKNSETVHQDHPQIPAFESFVEDTLTYTADIIPQLATHETEVTYYTYFGDGGIYRSLNKNTTVRAQQSSLRVAERRREIAARTAFNLRADMRHSAASPVMLEHLAEQLHTARATQRNISMMQNYGVQEHREVMTIYTIHHLEYQEIAETEESTLDMMTTTTLEPKSVVFDYRDFARLHQRLEQRYAYVFGYNTLDEARAESPYLDALLTSYSVHDIYHLYQQFFRDTTAFQFLYEMLHVLYRWHPVIASRKTETADDERQKLQKLTQPAQREIMESIFCPILEFDNPQDYPLSWHMATLKRPITQATLKDRFLQELPHILKWDD